MYVHVGAPKTGTTHLQSVLWASRPELREQGLALPGRRIEDQIHAAQDVRELYDERERSLKVRGGLDRFASDLERVHTPRALFSMEVIVSATPKQIERFYGALAGFDVHVIITARDLARQLPSIWQQTVKRRSDHPYDQYLGRVLDDPGLTHHVWRSQHIAEVARRWGATLTPDRVHVVTVPPAGARRELLLERFCSVIGVDPERINTEAGEANPSLGAPQAELMRRVNNALGDRLRDRKAGYNRLAKNYLAKTVLAAQSGPPLMLPARYADRVRELSTGMVEDIRANGYDVVGDLADLEPTVFGEPPDLRSPKRPDAEIAEAGVQALATMLEQRNEDLRLISELRDQVRPSPSRRQVWLRRQRRRVAALRGDPAPLLDRLRRRSDA